MVSVDLRSLILPVGIVRNFEFVLTCICFSLVASEGHRNSSYWAWCMFTWCFCCFMTLFILILEFTRLNNKVPISWDDFTTAFAVLATLLLLSTSIIYPTIYACPTCIRQICASVVSWICLGLYAIEVWLALRRPGEISGFLSTVSGLLKILETFVACIIFTSLDPTKYNLRGLQWCVAVYSLCFIFALLIILLTIGRLVSAFPFPFDKLVTIYNIVAAVMYMTAVVIWPLYAFETYSRPINCDSSCWDKLVVVTFMTAVNVLVYIFDAAYSIKLVFFIRQE
ncbi:myeloid-associated differentiation marker homolog [Pygocentrus nattereri]|uniref:myeloid-associated differentiation marker homolog n=1 Tax=Pygocentrus nattereri TaxID=42514 RepID=UPI0008145E11|nr:myeloid-associated differentiation marker homolog [Pygocentrus nattereri]